MHVHVLNSPSADRLLWLGGKGRLREDGCVVDLKQPTQDHIAGLVHFIEAETSPYFARRGRGIERR